MIEFAGIRFRGLTLDDVFAVRDRFTHIATVNAEYIVRANEDERLHRILEKSIATFDGQVPYMVARWRCKNRNFSKISGSELVYHICERAAQRQERVFLLGGMEDSNAQAVQILRERYSNLTIDGFSPIFCPYPFPKTHSELILARLRAFKPDYLLVGFGAVKQDYWIDDNRGELDKIRVKLAVGSGGTFEMVSGKMKRAPRFIQGIGLEGIYRLVCEPRLFRLKRLILSLRFLRYVK